MTERRAPRPSDEAQPPLATLQGRDDEVERAFGRSLALGLPLISVVSAVAVGAMASVGSALLVLAAGTLLGAIAFLWASVRTLSGDAPLPVGFETLTSRGHGVDALAEEKHRLLRALKDLESEHEIGKIDDADYHELSARYREEAKSVIREMDVEVAPFREQAEQLAREYLKKRGMGSEDAPARPTVPKAERIVCKTCGVSNEADAAFCKKCGSPTRKEA
jgi:hypothetical protein